MSTMLNQQHLKNCLHSSHYLQAVDTSDRPACLGLLFLLLQLARLGLLPHLLPVTRPFILLPPLPDPHNIHRIANKRKRLQLWGKTAQASFQGETNFTNQFNRVRLLYVEYFFNGAYFPSHHPHWRLLRLSK